jgi:hypothetical protein
MPNLVGEILHNRYAVIEHLAGEYYLVYDMRAQRRRTIQLEPRGPTRVEVKPSRPTQRPATLPRITVPVRRSAKSAPAATARGARGDRIGFPVRACAAATHITRFEAAWFARGEQLELEEEGAAEISDYNAYQLLLERLALQMP